MLGSHFQRSELPVVKHVVDVCGGTWVVVVNALEQDLCYLKTTKC